MQKISWVVLAVLLLANPAVAQNQFQTAFEVGIGYARPGIGDFDMATLLIQSDNYFFETGIGIATNSGLDGDTVLSWLLRAAARPIVLGNTLVHVGAELSLHTNGTFETTGSGTSLRVEATTLTSLAGFFGVSQPLNDHFNVALHVFPLAFGFGGDDTITKLATAQLGAHLLF